MHAAALVLALMINPEASRRRAAAAAAASTAAPTAPRRSSPSGTSRRRRRHRRQRRASRCRAAGFGVRLRGGRGGAVRRAARAASGRRAAPRARRRDRGRIVSTSSTGRRGLRARARTIGAVARRVRRRVAGAPARPRLRRGQSGRGVRLVDRRVRRGEPARRGLAGERGAARGAGGDSAGQPEFRACRGGSCFRTRDDLVTWNTGLGATLLAMGKGPPGHSPTMVNGSRDCIVRARRHRRRHAAGALVPTPAPTSRRASFTTRTSRSCGGTCAGSACPTRSSRTPRRTCSWSCTGGGIRSTRAGRRSRPGCSAS